MSKFDAGTAVEAVEWDFTAYGGGSGSVPEPTSERLDTLFKNIAGLMGEFKDLVGLDMESVSADQIEDLVHKFGNVDVADVFRRTNQALATFCENSPSFEEIDRLPYRVQQAFLGFVLGEFRPEGGTPTSKR